MDASYGGDTPLPEKSIKILEKLGNPQNPKRGNPLYNEIIGQPLSYQQLNQAPPLGKNIPLIVLYATKHCLPQEWTKQLMCMTPEQEKKHIDKQKEIYDMSRNHKLIAIEGDHNVFFNVDTVSKVVDEIIGLLPMHSTEK